jgi:thiol-disulfide isomerase/thioredoxin
MLLELSLRSTIPLLLLGGLVIGGCDRQSPPAGQANEAANAASAPAPGSEGAAKEAAGQVDRSHKGEDAPTFQFANPTGAKVTLASFRGKPVLLNLWATWCAPCIKEMPTLDALAETLGDKVEVLTVSQDTETAAKVGPFFQQAGFKRLQPYIDDQAALSMSMVANLPMTILYDSQGKEVWRMPVPIDWTSDAAKQLVAEAS